MTKAFDEAIAPIQRRFPLFTPVQIYDRKPNYEVVGYAIRWDGQKQVLVQPENGPPIDVGEQYEGIPWGQAWPLE